MPETFRTTYPSTKCIRDCTKIFCQKSSSLSSQSSPYSGYRHYVTRKGLLGIASSYAISFNSKQALFQTKKFWQILTIMAGSRFKIQNEVELLNVKLDIPLFLSDKSQLLKDDATESHSIASIRIQAEV